MLWRIAEWAGTVLAAGVVAGLVVAGVGAAVVWWLCRRARRLQGVTGMVARYALQGSAGAAAARRGRLAPRAMTELHERAGGPPAGG